MRFFINLTHYITKINKWVVFSTLVLLMPLVTFFAISRSLGYPVLGDVELVQFSMVLIIMGSLAFTESTNSHISIGIIVDKLPSFFQTIIDIIAQSLTIAFCFIICWVFIIKMNFLESSMLLGIPYYPFYILIVIGFAGWGLEAILKFLESIKKLIH
ncbi:TRAP transporter small permease [Virgibacillus sp. C22-A2]|uniref:TRAP transporter small permease n=1 Tax=Virgibacillus tibetensis TaxID=3042313 RepID=A0ABU6KI11_9BACI|nr:TRAP transporter small permease [Virgibacillus sp. C22-A2]